jgi:hypothetical protein
MSDIVKFTPAAGGVGFAKGMAEFNARRPTTQGGVPLLILQKTDGAWVYGRDRVEVEEGSRWVIDGNSVCMGYVAWHAGQPTERMAFIGQPSIDPASLPPTPAKAGWQEQVGFGLICLDGEDAGERVLYKTNTMGGLECWNAVFDAMVARAGQGLPHNPVVTMTNSSYTRAEDGGKVWKPVLEIVGWMGDETAQVSAPEAEEAGEDGEVDPIPFEANEPEPEPEPAPASQSRRRRSKS